MRKTRQNRKLLRSRIGVAFGAAVLLCSAGVLFAQGDAKQAKNDDPPAAKSPAKAAWIVMTGPIFEANANFVRRHLDEAVEGGAETIVLEIDSPGGELNACLELCETLQAVDQRVDVVAYVPREALSGAALAALACDRRYLAEGARLGDVGVIESGYDGAFRFAEAKLRSDVALRARQIASASGVPPAFAEAMVDKDLEVFRYENAATGEGAFLTEAEVAARPDRDDWTKGELVFESRKGTFFEVSGKRADELGIATDLAATDQDLLAALDLERAPAKRRWNWTDTAASILNNWFVSFLLIVVGLVALYAEFSSPGLSFGGLLAGLCFLLFFWSHFFGGTAQWLEVVLFGAGVIFLICEFTIFPGFGVAGVTGLILVVGSTILAMQKFVVPAESADWQALTISTSVVLGAFLASLGAIAILARYFHALPMLGSMVLRPPSAESIEGDRDAKKLGEGSSSGELFVGDWGVTVSPLKPTGMADFDDRRFVVATQGDFIDSGEPIRVIAVRGKRVVVERAPAK